MPSTAAELHDLYRDAGAGRVVGWSVHVEPSASAASAWLLDLVHVLRHLVRGDGERVRVSPQHPLRLEEPPDIERGDGQDRVRAGILGVAFSGNLLRSTDGSRDFQLE